MLKRFNDWITRALMVTAAVLAFLLCFLVVADVLGRVLFNSPVKGTPEIVSFSIVIICFLQAGFAIRSGGMLHVDTLVVRLPPPLAKLVWRSRCAGRSVLFCLHLLWQPGWCWACLELQ
jgi:TRAP-type C4-dicarboxylate transport system permease small subunit